MRTLGSIMEFLLTRTIYKIFLVLFILSRIILIAGDILAGSISGSLELLKVKKGK
jgi:hypothetical protein